MSSTDKARPALRLEMTLSPSWANVGALRTAVLHCIAAVTGEEQESVNIGTVASELVENAIKYGDWSGDGRGRVVLRVASDSEELEVSVSNPGRPESEGFRALQRTLEWIRSFPSPQEAYVARLSQVMTDDGYTGSRMGLVRIACEGGCVLTAESGPDERSVVVRATARIHAA